MEIKFTVFNQCQEQYTFNTDILKEGENLSHFLISNDDRTDKIVIIPMVRRGECMYYPLDIMEPEE
jgi:hypothetical protein